MLFHSAIFLIGFLPVTLFAYFLVGRISLRGAFAMLAFASLVFYAWWSYVYVALILASIAVNYAGSEVVQLLLRRIEPVRAKWVAGGVIAIDLLVLGYFKYLFFISVEANSLLGTNWNVGKIVLPIGISFYTFTQIAYIVDTLQGKVRERSLLSYVLFVTYFPHLVAGPVLHHAEMMPQFGIRENLNPRAANLACGVTFLVLGLFKKIVLADGCAPLANSVFGAAHGGVHALDAWIGAIAYSLQIYFDFSGYSDMAVGISLLFNIKLPINFYSPYRAKNIIDFWRCWHMTLSRFLRDYLYFPLGGNRKGVVRRYINLLVTMVLGGFWHGANWTFIAWGSLHGLYIIVNHLWRARSNELPPVSVGRARSVFNHGLTLLAVVVAWVFFRATTMHDALSMLNAMAGFHSSEVAELGVATTWNLIFLVALALLALFAPNTNQVLSYRFGIGADVPDFPTPWTWRPSPVVAIAISCLLFCTMVIGIAGRDRLEFLYFQF